jgi:hypothetical protein
MFNFFFEDDEARHICELQLVHSQMYTVRKEMGAHATYSTFRAALELMEMLDLDPEMGSDTKELEMLGALVWKGSANNRRDGPSRWEFDSDSAHQKALAPNSKRGRAGHQVVLSAFQSGRLRREVRDLRDRVEEQGTTIEILHEKITSQDARFAAFEARVFKLDSIQGPNPAAPTLLEPQGLKKKGKALAVRHASVLCETQRLRSSK